MNKKSQQYLLPFILVSMLFLLWGIANNMNDTLLAAFKRIMSMSDLQTSLVQFAFYGSYFCFAIPAALFIRRFSYKSGILVGLLIYAIGTMLFTPAGKVGSYGFFLFAIYVMAGGCSILETTANPLIMSLGSPETATRRLNIAQAFNPVGAIIGILISRFFILSQLNEAGAAERGAMSASTLAYLQRQELSSVSQTYLFIGITLVILMIVIDLVKMSDERDTSTLDSSIANIAKSLWQRKRYRYGVVTQFFYVGAQTCVWSFSIRLAMDELSIRETSASDYFLISILFFSIFRFLFTWLMKYYRPAKLMTIATVGAIISTLIVILCSGLTAILGMMFISAFMSLMFPTIYGLSLEGIVGSEAKLASSGLIMAIVGGALITPLQGLMSDLTGNVSVSFVVPLICFIVVLIYSIESFVTSRK